LTSQTNKSIDIKKIISRMILFVSLGILAHLIFLLWTTDREIIAHLSKIKIPYLIVIACLSLVPWLGGTIRLLLWTRFIDHPLSPKACLKTCVYTDLGGALSPTMIGGGPVKLGYLINKGMSPAKAGLITALNGFEDFVMYTTILIISFFHIREKIGRIFSSISQFISVNYMKMIITLGIIIFIRYLLKSSNFSLAQMLPESWNTRFAKIKEAAKENWGEWRNLVKHVFKKGKGTFVLSFLILMLSWMARFSILLIILWSMGVDFKPFQMYLQQWIVYITMMFIPTPGASGGAEASFYLIFDGEIPRKLLTLIVSIWRFFTYYFMLFTAIILVQLFSVRLKKVKN